MLLFLCCFRRAEGQGGRVGGLPIINDTVFMVVIKVEVLKTFGYREKFFFLASSLNHLGFIVCVEISFIGVLKGGMTVYMEKYH